jgi:hypothetical protein
MTPKEKAQELFDKYFEVTNNYYQAKECALIAVDEIMNVLNKHLPAEDYKVMNYYQEVKQEIEAL